jgi:hypothetical protein
MLAQISVRLLAMKPVVEKRIAAIPLMILGVSLVFAGALVGFLLYNPEIVTDVANPFPERKLLPFCIGSTVALIGITLLLLGQAYFEISNLETRLAALEATARNAHPATAPGTSSSIGQVQG